MKTPLALLVLLLALGSVPGAPGETPWLPPPAAAQGRVAALQIQVRLDHPNWTYALDEPVKFRVTLVADDEPVGDVTVKYQVGLEMLPAEQKTAVVPAEGLTIDGGTLHEPGFLRCIVTAEVGGIKYRSLATAGFAPENIRPTQAEPADFDAFWAAGKAALAQIPLDARMTLLPDECTSQIEVYHVSFQNVGVGSHPKPTPNTPH